MRTSASACAVAASLLAVFGAENALSSEREPIRGEVSIPAGPLRDALAALGRRTGLQVTASAEAIEGKRASAVVDAVSAEAALTAMLAGTGLVFTLNGAGRATVYDIVRVQDAGQVTPLEGINVEGQGGGLGAPNATGYGRADGFVASRSLTGTKTDTPLIETPQAISVITSEKLKAQGSQSLASAVRYSAGVSGEPYGPDPRASFLQLRGFSVSDEIFFRDGLRISGSAFATFMRIEPYGAERLEILRGPSSVLYGQGAPAGILNYVSKRPTDYAFGEISGSVGSWDRYQSEFDFGGPVGTDGVWSYRVTGLAREGDTQVDRFYDDRAFIAPAVTYKPTDATTLTVLGSYQKDHNGYATQFLPAKGTLYRKNGRYISDSRFTGEPGDHDDQEMASIGYMFEHKFSETFTVRQNARYAWLWNEQVGAYGGTGYATPQSGSLLERIGDFGRSTVNSFVVDNQAQVKFDSGPLAHTFLAGVEYRYGRLKDTGGDATIDPIDVFSPRYGATRGKFTLYQDTFTDQKQTGVYAQDQIKLGRWALTLGGRYDWADTTTRDYLNHKPDVSHSRDLQQDKAFTGRAGLLYLFENGLAPYVSYSESFFPTVGQDQETNTPFKPETGEQYEAGVKFQPPGWNSLITAAVFDLKRDNFTMDRTITIPGEPERFVTVQGGKMRSRGFEVEGLASLRSGWNASVSYSYANSEYLTTDDNTRKGAMPAAIPKQQFAAWTDHTLQTGALAGLAAGAGVRVNGRSWGDDLNTFRAPAVALFDAMVSYKRNGYQLQVNATNLADKRHVAGCFSRTQCFYGESRKVIAKLTYSWGGPAAVTPAVVKN